MVQQRNDEQHVDVPVHEIFKECDEVATLMPQ